MLLVVFSKNAKGPCSTPPGPCVGKPGGPRGPADCCKNIACWGETIGPGPPLPEATEIPGGPCKQMHVVSVRNPHGAH